MIKRKHWSRSDTLIPRFLFTVEIAFFIMLLLQIYLLFVGNNQEFLDNSLYLMIRILKISAAAALITAFNTIFTTLYFFPPRMRGRFKFFLNSAILIVFSLIIISVLSFFQAWMV